MPYLARLPKRPDFLCRWLFYFQGDWHLSVPPLLLSYHRGFLLVQVKRATLRKDFQVKTSQRLLVGWLS